MNIADSLETGSAQYPERTALVFEEHTFSYAQLNRLSNQMANLLAQLGVQVGDRVALFLPNIPAFVAAYFGTQKLGAIAVTLNSALQQEEVRFILQDSGASVLITTQALSARVEKQSLPGLCEILIAETADGAQAPLFARLAESPPTAETRDLAPDSPSTLLYTSGTTGFPKGALLSHGNVARAMRPIAERLQLQPRDRALLCVPLYHCFGLHAVLNASLWAGATVILQRQFEVAATQAAIETRQITLLFGVPTIYTLLLEHAQALASVRASFSAAAPLPAGLASAWRARFGSRLFQIYGLSETPPLACTNYPTHSTGSGQAPDKQDSIGTPIEGVEMLIVDPETRETLGPGASGEIVIQGACVMLGYWQQPQATAEVVEAGRFHTGDLGYRDAEGYFYVQDRLRDMINVSGQKVFPAEVEAVLMAYPGVQDAAVFGLADALMGEQVHAAVQAESGARLDMDALLRHCQERLAYFKVPTQLRLVDKIPRNPTGKILRRVLRDAGQDSRVCASDTAHTLHLLEPAARYRAVLEEVQSQVAALLRLPDTALPLDPLRKFSEYGMKSLDALKLRNLLISRFARQLPETVAFQYATPHALAEYLAGQVLNRGASGVDSLDEFSGLRQVSAGERQPLSMAQYESWAYQRSHPQSCMANHPEGLRLLGPLDIGRLQACLEEVARRHAVLRTRYEEAQNQPWQIHEKHSGMNLGFFDWSALDEAQQQQALLDWMEREVLRSPFDLSRLPLWRCFVARIQEHEHYLLFVFHHIQIDSVSFGLLQNELWRLYAAFSQNQPSPLAPLPIQYSDYAAWQRRLLTPERLAEKRAYWQKLLADPPAPLRLSQRQKTGIAASSQVITRRLGEDHTRQLDAFSRQQDTTVFSVLMTAFALTLYPYSDGRGMIIGSPMSNKRTHPWLEQLIGHFAGKTSLRMDFTCPEPAGRPDVRELLRRTHAVMEDAFAHQDLTYAQIQLSHSTLVQSIVEVGSGQVQSDGGEVAEQPFQAVLNFIPTRPVSAHLPPGFPLQIEHLKKLNYGVVIPDINLLIRHQQTASGSRLTLNWRYREDLFQAEDIELLAQRFEKILDRLRHNPQGTIEQIVE